MSAYSFLPAPVRGTVSGPSPLLSGQIIYAESTTATDGVTMTFAFAVPIGTLLTAHVGGAAQSPGDCSVVAGALVLSGMPAPGDPANVGLVKVGALYLR
jgi:hypothetical protein